MSAILGIGAAILSQILGLQPKLAFVDEAMNTPMGDYSNNHGTASHNTAQPATRVVTPEVNFLHNRPYAGHSLMLLQPKHPNSQLANVQDITTAIQPSSINQDSPSSVQSPCHHSVPDLEAASPSPSAVVSNAIPGRGHSPKASRLLRSKPLAAGAVLVLGVLPLIVLPGVIMGALTGQILMGIALSSAVATVVGVFAGCYYYIKRDG